jgi:hypothetical protein
MLFRRKFFSGPLVNSGEMGVSRPELRLSKSSTAQVRVMAGKSRNSDGVTGRSNDAVFVL